MNNYSTDTNDGGHLTILGFTPLIDEIVHKYDLSTAAVFGVARRFCQQQHVGEASLAKTIGLTLRCVTNHLQKLAQAGLIIDQMPTRNINRIRTQLHQQIGIGGPLKCREIVWKTSAHVWKCL